MATLPASFRASAFLPGDPQATGISGVVLDNQGEPVPGVTLRLRDFDLSTVTDDRGAFHLTGVPVGQTFLIADASTTTREGFLGEPRGSSCSRSQALKTVFPNRSTFFHSTSRTELRWTKREVER